MSRLKYKYSLDKFGNVISISEAKKGDVYYFGQTDIELIVKDGGTNRKHFSLKSGGSIDSLFSGGGESPEHYNAKYEIKKQGFFYWNDIKIQPSRIEIEHEFKTIDKISDVVFFDEDDNLMCVIEVYFTNKKTDKDKDDFKKLNTTVYEYNIKNGSTELLCWSVPSEQNRISEEEKLELWYDGTIKSKEKEIERLEKELHDKTGNLRESIREERISYGKLERESEEIELNIKKSSEGTRQIEQESYDVETRLKRGLSAEHGFRDRIKWTKKEIENLEEQEQGVGELRLQVEKAEYEVANVEGENRAIKGNIQWQENRSRQSHTVIQRNL